MGMVLWRQAALYGACWEVHRAGAHTLDPHILRMLSAALRAAVMAVYAAALSLDVPTELRPPLPASEKGVLQMLFDTRLLLDVLAAHDDDDAPSDVRKVCATRGL
jgi:hypothetical protein